MPEPVITTEGLVKDYGPVRAVGPLTVEIPRGVWGLLGPNGAGKTTLIRLLLGLADATRGSASVLGLNPAYEARQVRERIGFVPERDAYVPGLTGVRFVAYAGRLSGLPATDAKQRAHEALNFVGIEEARYRPVDGYSQGMRQRAKLAQAIVHDPDLIFLDEPTNGLDPDGRNEMLDLVAALARDHGIAMLLASHVLPEVERVCDGALVLEEGEAVANATLDELKAVRKETYLVRIRGRGEGFDEALAARGGEVERTPEGLRVVRLSGEGGPRRVLEAASQAGVQVRHLEPARSSLEDALVAALDEEAGR